MDQSAEAQFGERERPAIELEHSTGSEVVSMPLDKSGRKHLELSDRQLGHIRIRERQESTKF